MNTELFNLGFQSFKLLNVCLATAKHRFKWLKMYVICTIKSQYNYIEIEKIYNIEQLIMQDYEGAK